MNGLSLFSGLLNRWKLIRRQKFLEHILRLGFELLVDQVLKSLARDSLDLVFLAFGVTLGRLGILFHIFVFLARLSHGRVDVGLD